MSVLQGGPFPQKYSRLFSSGNYSNRPDSELHGHARDALQHSLSPDVKQVQLCGITYATPEAQANSSPQIEYSRMHPLFNCIVEKR